MLNYSVKVGASEDSNQNDTVVSNEKIGANPFPGLRPFTIDESHLFFGREGQVDEILIKLSKHRSVTVLGYSGSGKSSLMHCGLVPVLYGGFMTNQGPHWKILTVRPGNSPILNLSTAVVNSLVHEGKIEEHDRKIYLSIINSILRSGPTGLIEVAKYLQKSPDENVFFLLDQFEELFRYKVLEGEDSANEASLYVNLILTALNQVEVPIYISLSMRSDFIGECASFAGLTQMINASNYLVPQMSREQKRMAIEGPVAVGGGRISPRLVKRLLSDIGDNQDQLPILQHALMRTWDYWVESHDPGEPMDIRHYNSIGRISQALSLHANEAYDELTTREKEIAEVLFKNITEKNQENQEMRRPAKVGVIAELAEAQEDEVIEVVEKFRKTGRSFLMPGIAVQLNANSVIELSHESLMRIWTRLSTWVDEEFESAQMYKRVSDAAAMYQIGKTSLWRPPDLQLALNWQKKQRPTRTWAQRYDIAFERAIVFLDTSRITYEAELKNQEMLQRRLLRRARVTNIVLAIFLLVSIGFFFYGYIQQIEAESAARLAIEQRVLADKARDEANSQRAIAEQQTKLAKEQAQVILSKSEQLEKNYRLLTQALNEAEVQKQNALTNLTIANEQRDSARLARDEARTQFNRAEKEFDNANRLLMLSIAQSLEVKSLGIDDKDLAGLTAMQGYLFHTQYEGKKYDPYVFSGLYYAVAKLSGLNYNAIKTKNNLKNKMFALAVSRKSNAFFTTGNDGKIIEGDFIAQKAEILISENEGYPNRVLALSKDEKYLVNGSDSSFLEIFDLTQTDRKSIKVRGHQGIVNDIKFLPDNSGFISVSTDRTIRLTNAASRQSKVIATLPYSVKSIDISPDGKSLVGVSVSGRAILLDLTTNLFQEILNESPNRILSVAYHPERSLIACGIESVNEKGLPAKGIVKLFDLKSRKVVKELGGHAAGISDVEFSPDGLLLASAGLDSKLQMWVVDHEDDLPIIMNNNNGFVWSIAFAKGSNYLIASCNDGEIRVWPTDTRMLAEKVCPQLKRDMTKEEWSTYVGNNVPYESTCRSLLIKDR